MWWARFKQSVRVIAVGVVLAVMGSFLQSLLTAVAVPQSYFALFGQHHQLAMLILNLIESLLAFGLLSILVGIWLGHFAPKAWFLNALLLCVGAYFYLLVLAAPAQGLFTTLKTSPWLLPGWLLWPVLLFVSTYLAGRVANRKIA